MLVFILSLILVTVQAAEMGRDIGAVSSGGRRASACLRDTSTRCVRPAHGLIAWWRGDLHLAGSFLTRKARTIREILSSFTRNRWKMPRQKMCDTIARFGPARDARLLPEINSGLMVPMQTSVPGQPDLTPVKKSGFLVPFVSRVIRSNRYGGRGLPGRRTRCPWRIAPFTERPSRPQR